MITVIFTHDGTTKNWERFKASSAIRTGGAQDIHLDPTKDLLLGPIYLPLGAAKEDFKVTIER